MTKPKTVFTLTKIVNIKAGEGKGKGFSVDQEELHFTSAIGEVAFSPSPTPWAYYMTMTGTVPKRMANKVLDSYIDALSAQVNKRGPQVTIGFPIEV